MIISKFVNSFAIFGICYGLLFKVQHYPGASSLLIFGGVMLVLGFIIKRDSFFGQKSAVFIVLQSLSVILILVGFLFKVQHYPGASVMTILGWNIMAVSLIIEMILRTRKSKIDISEFGKNNDS